MKIRRIHNDIGVTLIEAMVATVIVAVLALGGLTYQAYGAAHFHIAKAELTATRAGQLVIEDWKGSGAPDIVNYDATELGVGFVKPVAGNNSYYTITIDGIKLHLNLSFADVAVDSDTGDVLRQLNVQVQWQRDSSASGAQADDPSITLSTYARLGQD
jgi:Tfp pilus assembly major pilin PilA